MSKNVLIFSVFFIFMCASYIFAEPLNPDISVIGQFYSKYTNDTQDVNHDKTTMNIGETELVFESNLNPYSKGTFVFSISNDEGFQTEEAYITVFNGLPDGLALKGGKYRIGFGKLNTEHPHSYPFMEAPRVMSAMLPGEESFNDTSAQVSYLLPLTDKVASVVSVDVLNGSSFHPEEDKYSSAWVARLSNSFLIKDVTPLEIGFSFTQGTNNVEWDKKTTVFGMDAKTKLKLSKTSNLTIQGEYFYNDSDVLVSESTGESINSKRSGFYTFANLSFLQRWNAGLIYDQYQKPEDKNLTDMTAKIFVGYSLMEETTVLRLAYEKFTPQDGEISDTVSFQLVFMMGPHKAHKF
ncbi:MAG: hypothetical protein PHR82_07950 [Endomicrobiaceae bacterium]|nr:hypothetical protein [Endomicrobiaceae bacterium]